MAATVQQLQQGASLAGMVSGSDLSSPVLASAAPADPTPAQQQFLQAMAEGTVAPSTGSYTVNYTEQYLQAIARNLTSAKVTSQTTTAYPQARNLLAGWFSLLTPQGQAAAASQLSALAPGIDASALASQDAAHAGPSALPGGNPSATALAEADKIPNASVAEAMSVIISSMDPSLYASAGKIAMNSQLISGIISEGMTLIGYLTQNAKDAINGSNV